VDVWRAAVTAVRGHETTETVTWVTTHRDPLMVGGAVVAALLLFFGNLSLWWFLFFAIVIGAYELVVYRVSQRAATPTPET
jgi:type III secretory pathway component EscV